MSYRFSLVHLFFVALVFASCNNNSTESAAASDTTQTTQPDSLNASSEQAVPDTASFPQSDDGDLVMSYTPKEILDIKENFKFTGDSSNPAAIDSFYTAV